MTHLLSCFLHIALLYILLGTRVRKRWTPFTSGGLRTLIFLSVTGFCTYVVFLNINEFAFLLMKNLNM